ncbi:DUF4913 domain-containing protein [Pseudarthrobacter sp. CC12]|uniref:DUF4913 domain-containing protein n=1 Tax=Pseudarthrobacter sp. CC12 TaxID=3029193 RepID=UPI0032641F7B
MLPTYVRDVDGRAAKWCIEWYFHPEAVSRVEALWRAWEHLRLDGSTGISVWFKDHADHHMYVLLAPAALSTCATCKTPGRRTPRTKKGSGRLISRCTNYSYLTSTSSKLNSEAFRIEGKLAQISCMRIPLKLTAGKAMMRTCEWLAVGRRAEQFAERCSHRYATWPNRA